MNECDRLKSKLSAFVDAALPVGEREAVALHLCRCDECAAETAELRRLRNLLRQPTAGSAPQDLSTRLVSIAGDHAAEPLWTRPFTREPFHAGLPSRRQRMRHRLVAGGTSLIAVAAAAVAAGWFAAPATRTPTLDPAPIARSEFVAALDQVPVKNSAADAWLLVNRASEESLTATAPQPAQAVTLTSEQAYAALARADAEVDAPLTGNLQIEARHRAGYWSTTATVRQRPVGIQVSLPQRDGRPIEGFMPRSQSLGVDLVAANHQLRGGPGPMVAGRPTTVIEAIGQPHPAARWWLDGDSGILLWRTTYDPSGAIRESIGYTSISFEGTQRVTHLPPRLTTESLPTTLTLSSVPLLAGNGCACRSQAGGLDLVTMRGDVKSVLHTVYGDGITTVSVLESHGALAGAPDGFAWDPALRAYVNQGLPTTIVWQSSDRVFTVVTDGSQELAQRVVAELPHRPPVLRTRTERVVDGWRAMAKAVLPR